MSTTAEAIELLYHFYEHQMPLLPLSLFFYCQSCLFCCCFVLQMIIPSIGPHTLMFGAVYICIYP